MKKELEICNNECWKGVVCMDRVDQQREVVDVESQESVTSCKSIQKCIEDNKDKISKRVIMLMVTLWLMIPL